MRAIESPSTLDDQQWLTYWVLYSFITLFKLSFWSILQMLHNRSPPLFSSIRIRGVTHNLTRHTSDARVVKNPGYIDWVAMLPFWPYLKLLVCTWLVLPIFNGAAVHLREDRMRKYVKIGVAIDTKHFEGKKKGSPDDAARC
ncbi:HVA22-like protein [Drosera capensis]